MTPQNQGLDKVFGQITPAGPAALNNPATGFATLLVTGVRLFLIVAAISALIYMLWGAYQWITSGGDKDALSNAQARIRQAVIGLVLVIVALSVFILVTSDVLGIIKRGPNGTWTISLPTLGK